MIDGKEYEGELDPENKACGEGSLKSLSGDMFEGTFKDNLYHGFGKNSIQKCFSNVLTVCLGVTTYPNGYRHEGEWAQGKWHGKSTTYSADGQINNRVFNNGMPVSTT